LIFAYIHILQNREALAGKTLKFESRLEDSVRYMNVVDMTDPTKRIYYEVKSVKTVPPTNFNAQFVKGLSESNVTDLGQIQWIFDGAKSPENFYGNLTQAIENMPLTECLALKFEVGSITELIALLISRFDNIFILVD
jgi:hypothetical protein